MAIQRILTGESTKRGEDYMIKGTSFEIVEHIYTFHTDKDGYTKELNLIKWNGNKPVFDIRCWSSTHDSLTRGVTLTPEETRDILYALIEHYITTDNK